MVRHDALGHQATWPRSTMMPVPSPPQDAQFAHRHPHPGAPNSRRTMSAMSFPRGFHQADIPFRHHFLDAGRHLAVVDGVGHVVGMAGLMVIRPISRSSMTGWVLCAPIHTAR